MNFGKLRKFEEGKTSRDKTQLRKNPLYLIILLATLFQYPQTIKSDEIFLKCIGKFEINRGSLIKPDWEKTYLKINRDGLISTIDNSGIIREGRTIKRRNSYIISYRDIRNRLKEKYEINIKYGTYRVSHPQNKRILIGTCQKGRG